MAQSTGPISNSIIGTGKRICFAAEVDSEVPRQLHRAPTPYPKELRNLARHARNLHHQSIHDQRVSPNCLYLSFIITLIIKIIYNIKIQIFFSKDEIVIDETILQHKYYVFVFLQIRYSLRRTHSRPQSP